MECFKFAHASAPRWQDAVEACFNQMEPAKTPANLGFIYISDLFAQDISDILDRIKQRTGISHWVGTVGIGICGQTTEYFDVPAIAMMFGSFPEDAFQVFTTMGEEFNEFSRTHQTWSGKKQPLFAIVHGDPRNTQIANLVFQFSERIGEGFLVGGLTSSRHNYVQIANDVVEGALSGVLFSSRIAVSTRLTQGCSAIGPRREITEAQNNVIIKIDDRPALEVFNEDIGELLAQDLNKVAGYIFAGLPVVGSDRGDYLVRPLIGVDPEHQLLAIGETVTSGMPILFTRRDAQTAYTDLLKMLKAIKQDLTQPPRGGIYYSCLGRGRNLFGDDNQELKAIQSVLGDFPLVGFFANGEISHQHLYGYTGVLTLFL